MSSKSWQYPFLLYFWQDKLGGQVLQNLVSCVMCLENVLVNIFMSSDLIDFVVLRDHVAVYGRREMKFDVKTPG